MPLCTTQWEGRYKRYFSDYNKTKKLASNMKKMIIPQRKIFWCPIPVRTMGTLLPYGEIKLFLNVVELECNDLVCVGFG